jgi:hypothetical protein
LTWSSERGTSWTLPDIGQSPGNGGSKDVTVNANKTYTYTVTNSTGTATCKAVVSIGEPPNCTETDTCPETGFNTCEVTLAKTAGELRYGIGSSNKITIQSGEVVYAAVRAVDDLGQVIPLGNVFFTPQNDFTFYESRRNLGDVYYAYPIVSKKYSILGVFPSSEQVECDAEVIVGSNPLAPAYGPWLQSKRGNVLALGYIQSQKEAELGSRPAASADKEAEFVIMSYMASTSAASNFCSTNKYNFGTISPPSCSYSAGGSGYLAKVTNKADIGDTTRDPAIASLDRAIAARTGLASDACTAKAPYLVSTLAGATVTLPISLGANNSCPVIITSGSTTLNASTVQSGRGTLYVNGDLTINGNINYSYAPSYGSVNLIPNLGIVVKGNITIAGNVTQIDASLYATGKIKTCSSYPGGTSCNQKLIIRGKMAAANGFVLGRNAYGNSPAELVIGSGLVEAFPPPGFVNLTTSASSQKVITTEANPRF